MQDAIIHRLEIIGDAMKNIPVTLRKKYSATLAADSEGERYDL
jgi:uncharacterized protein with HEPN domain